MWIEPGQAISSVSFSATTLFYVFFVFFVVFVVFV
jgi:hypothetical protein